MGPPNRWRPDRDRDECGMLPAPTVRLERRGERSPGGSVSGPSRVPRHSHVILDSLRAVCLV